MKRISLTKTDLAILENALIEFGSVVSFSQLCMLFDEEIEYARIRISKLVKQGWLKRIKRGVFVISDLSTRGVLSISHNVVVNILVKDAYISFEGALQFHGIYDQLLTNINAVSLKRYRTTSIDRYIYSFIYTQEKYFYGWEEYSIDNQSVKIANIEKALIDLIQFHRSRYTTDLVLEKLSTFRDDIDHHRLTEYGFKANLTTQRILGFLLDCVGMDSGSLHSAVQDRHSVSFISKSEENLYNHKWKLYYDQHFKQYLQH